MPWLRGGMNDALDSSKHTLPLPNVHLMVRETLTLPPIRRPLIGLGVL